MPVVTDQLITRIAVAGSSVYRAEFAAAAVAVRGLTGSLDEAGHAQAAYAAGAAVGAVGIIRELGKAAVASGEDTANFERAVGNFKGAFPDAEMRRFTGDMERLTGIEDDTIAGTVGLLGTFRLTQEQARRLTPAILNASEALKAQGVTADQLAVQVGKALEGGMVQSLRRSGIFVDQARFSMDRLGAVVDALEKQGGNAAERFRTTLPGALQETRSAAHGALEALGEPLVGPLRTLAGWVTALARGFSDLPGPVRGAAAVIGVIAAGALGVYSAATLWALTQTGRYTKALYELAKAHGAAALAADADALSQGAAGAAAGGAGGAAAAGGTAAAGGYTSIANTAAAKAAVPAAAKVGLLARLLPFLTLLIPHVDPGGEHPERKWLEQIAERLGLGGGATADQPKTEQQRTNELLEKQNELLKSIRDLTGDNALNTHGDLTGSLLRGTILTRTRALQH